MRQRSVNRGKVLLNNRIALLGIGLLNRVLDFRNRLLARQNVGNREEARLHDGIDTLTHTGFARHFHRVDGVELELLVNNLLLHLVSQVIPDFVGVIRRVQKEGRPRLGNAQNIHFVHKLELVARHKVRLVNQIGGFNRVVRKSEVRRCHGAGFAAVVNKVALAVFAGVFGDNLNGVLVGADRPVCTQTEEHGAHDVFALGVNAVVVWQRFVGNIVVNADRKAVKRLGGSAVVINRLDHARRKFFGRQAVTSADDFRHRDFARRRGLRQRGNDIKIKRFARRAGFLGSVKHGNNLGALRQRGDKRLRRERTIQVDFNHAVFGALCVQIVNGFLHGFGAGTHNHDNLFGIGRAVVVNNMILSAGDFRKLVHFFLNDTRHGVIILVRRLASLEEHVGVLRRSADNRRFGAQSVLGVKVIVNAFKHRAQVVVGKNFDFLDFMRCAETVKEVHKRHARPQRGSLGNRRHIMRFLHRVGAKHRKAGLAAAHHVGVVAENRQRVIRERARRNVHHERRKFAGDFIHIRNHQQQAL